jgi:hypothetical protein
MNKLTPSELEFIITRIINSTMDTIRNSDNSEFSQGEKQACYQVLDIIKSELDVRDVDLSEYGLDVVLEKLI